eukprot:CAMPEP_0171101346 /NCGR_PEP_ID=MMETSP0766_2-20121228/54731_1 /TAXON_ID=439317 /ORGANISM="Gambierdiscus australes, Strain CAWD 149" /LENGTH=584 /DNA_ID=CAMNT_0011561375 /DNA_START=267 /DNA_END=2021 /DNA_ORIENTATION=+
MGDPFGKWCMVEDYMCEDAEWGYCFSEDAAAAAAAVQGCADFDDWRDSDGDNCDAYSRNRWCTLEGEEGPGWHREEWGALVTFGANGFTALTACCACRGGNASAGNASEGRYTYNMCACKSTWQVDNLACANFCCNPDNDIGGSWCMVEDFNCEDLEWGYCRPLGGVVTAGSAPQGEHHGHCNDTPGWRDLDGEGCSAYAAFAYCTEVGGYGLGWSMEWGTFSSFARDGVSGADRSCCACGGGQRDPGTPGSVGAGTEHYSPSLDKIYTTWNGCECNETWSEEGLGTCETYCCNLEHDHVGAWCKVKDPSCESADWGYCRTSGLGTVARPQYDAAHCSDVPLWGDADGDGCHVYATSAWCTATGEPGTGWHEEWGSLQNFQRNGHWAATACCACGGGVRQGAHQPSTVEQLRSWVREENTFMWRVVSGPCTMDEKGCIMSGGYPNHYAPGEHCQIGVDKDKARPIYVVSFDTEFGYDVMRINGVLYSGQKQPNGVVPASTIHWGADALDERTGWKLCPRGESNPSHPVVRAIKVLGLGVLSILFCCCLCLSGLWLRAKRNAPTGDGLGAGPLSIGKKYARQVDQ